MIRVIIQGPALFFPVPPVFWSFSSSPPKGEEERGIEVNIECNV